MQVPIARADGSESSMQLMLHPERYTTGFNYERDFCDLQQFMLQEFGSVQACYLGGFDNRLYMPPKDRIIEVREALETCHRFSGINLEKITVTNRDYGGHKLAIDYVDSLTPGKNCLVISPGIYQVGTLECGGITSHTGTLVRLSDGLTLKFMAGHSGVDTIDWRASRAVER